MFYFNLTEKDIKIIEKIIDLTNSIYEIYQKLYNLEINNEKNSEEYKKNIEYLKMLIEMEQKYYHELDLNKEKADEIINYIFDSPFISVKEGYNILFEEKNSYLCSRILFNLSSLILVQFNINYDEKFEVQVVENTLSEYEMIDFIKLVEHFYFNNFLIILESFIKEEKDTKLNNLLKKSKYCLSFTNKDVEFDLLEANFDSEKIKNVSLDYFKELYGMNGYIFNYLKNCFGYIEVQKYINRLSKMTDINGKKTKNIAKFINNMFLFNSALLFMDKTTIEFLKNELKRCGFDFDNEETIGLEAIKEGFNSVDENRKKLSLL